MRCFDSKHFVFQEIATESSRITSENFRRVADDYK